jgi:glycosyltransferase involved in cell wall biosynthesis
MNSKPLVSIIIPVYNGANYVDKAIQSALAQTYQNIEILVINDGSCDCGATDDVIKQYGSRVRYIKKENGGVATALNLGIREMHGEYFSWLSHDDFYLPNKITSQINFLATLNFSDVVVYSNHYNLIEATGALFLIRHRMHRDLDFRAREIVANNQIHGCSLLIPRKAFEQVGLFDEKLRVAQDYEMWFRIAQKFQFRYSDETVVTGRVHDKQVGVRLHDRVLVENDEFRINCIRQLGRDEITATGKGSFALGLLHLSMRMARMGCPLSHAYLLSTLKQVVLNRNSTTRERFLAVYAIGLDAGHITVVKMARKIKKHY